MDITKHSIDQAYYSPTLWKLFYLPQLLILLRRTQDLFEFGLIKGYSACFLSKPDNTKVKPRPPNWVIFYVKMACNFK